jgi:signal transduction histidine kinase
LQEVLDGKSGVFRLRNINRDGADGVITYLSIKAVPADEEHPAEGLLLIIEDTTMTSNLERELVQDRNELRLTKNELSRANEELLRLNRLKSLFLSIAAHDLRSPLTAMRGYTEMAVNSLSSDLSRAGEYLGIVISLTESFNRLINDFLDLDIIEQGKLKVRPQACNLNRIVQEVSNVMRGVAGRKEITIETRLGDMPVPVWGDPERLSQIMFNLIGNAIKYTNEGDCVVIATGVEMEQGVIRVTDHGPGIPPSDLTKLFDLYHRTEEAQKGKARGLGLGLFIVKSLVDLQHGQILVSSELGKGATFTVYLPLSRTDQAAVQGAGA